MKKERFIEFIDIDIENDRLSQSIREILPEEIDFNDYILVNRNGFDALTKMYAKHSKTLKAIDEVSKQGDMPLDRQPLTYLLNNSCDATNIYEYIINNLSYNKVMQLKDLLQYGKNARHSV